MPAMVVQYEGRLPGWGKVPASRFNEVRRLAWEAVGNHWHDHFRDKHFTKSGATEYAYMPRAGENQTGKGFWRSYTGRKQKYLRHTRPLVFSGESERRVKTRRFVIRSRGSASSLRIVLNAPALNLRPKGGRIDMRREMTEVSPREFGELIGVFEETITRLLQ